MFQRLLILLIPLPLCLGLVCYYCGVFLSAPTPHCRGKPRNISCDPDYYGCLTLTGENADGTYYVEKRCAEKDDDRTVGCKEIDLHGIIKVQQCFCEGDLCNDVRQSFAYNSLYAALISIIIYTA
ncbi:hypothetical protein KIN20_031487 [Parelaphostrongylus tenuis]|uniref:Protein sleepless n=1 Tax=Parelaphostrongylus tenuis TaxID=148309 RepID=A0AAD5R579_PARTN|nr:hypothetical protein KIN20_031487 [Parelaphostrongylus tenuis]